MLHPGEKRLIQLVTEECRSVPDGFATDVIEVPRMAAALDPATAQHLHRMLDRLAAALDA